MLLSSFYNLYRLRKNQWLKTSELEEIQRRKLQRIIKHAYENVEYYRKLFDSAGVRPENIRTVEDLTKIPITNKLQLQKLSSEEIVAKDVNINKCKKLATSGSTGIPLSVLLTKRDKDFYDIVWARAFLENGQRLWDTTASFWTTIPRRFWFEHFGLWRKYIIPYGDKLEQQIETLKSISPDIIKGYSPKTFALASVMKEKQVKNIRPRLIFSMGTIMDSYSREFIESAFGAEVFDYYGSIELGCIAWECSQHRGYHINSDTIVLELLKGGKAARPGEMGRIVCTGLHSFAMPFIRYEIGDLGIASDYKCSCGRALPLLNSIEGRADDLIVAQNGSYYSSPDFIRYMRAIPGIGQFRIIQESTKDIAVQIAPGKDFSEETVRQVENTMLRLVGKDFDVKVEVVDVIPGDPSGKARCIISKVKKEF